MLLKHMIKLVQLHKGDLLLSEEELGKFLPLVQVGKGKGKGLQ
jgi:hypothetical protein